MEQLRLHLRPAFEDGGPYSEHDRLRRLQARSSRARCIFVDRPEDADVVLLTDSGDSVNGRWKFNPDLIRLLAHPLVRRFRDRCFLYNELDRPRPYLPGLYAYMEWFPGIERISAPIAPTGALHEAHGPGATDVAPDRDRDLLFSFMGRNAHPVRARLFSTRFDRDDVVVADTTAVYDHYGARPDESGKRAYVDVMRRSRWALCPRGASSGSLRLFEAMRMGVAPVVLSDQWQRPLGPDWDSCSLWLPEASYRDLPEVLLSAGDRWRAMGRAARRAYETFFAEHTIFDQLIDALEALRRQQRRPSTVATYTRQLRDLSAQLVGLPSPMITRVRRRGISAISSRSQVPPELGG